VPDHLARRIARAGEVIARTLARRRLPSLSEHSSCPARTRRTLPSLSEHCSLAEGERRTDSALFRV
ncbi:hypothetical protein A2U01_0091739, partial [Trifolium medium]|nr:hypothetical protein [Trifolium medium]